MPDQATLADDDGFDFFDDERSIVVLVPTPSAPYCYLYEALLWVALQRVPLVSHWADGIDIRVDTEDTEDAKPRIEFEPATEEECQKIGLPSNPEHAVYEGDEYHLEPEAIERLLCIVTDDSDRKRLLADLEASKTYYQALTAWAPQFEAFLDLHKSRLFLALREGKVLSVGKLFSSTMAADFPEPLTDDEWAAWVKEPWHRIDPMNWLSTGVDWRECRAVGRDAAHALILVSTMELMVAFPAVPEPVRSAVKIGDCYAILEEANTARTGDGRRGRPSFDWDGFHVEMAKRVLTGNMPDKQEALIAEMQAWCLQSWGRTVGRSTVLQKVKPYYAVFMRGSDKSAA